MLQVKSQYGCVHVGYGQWRRHCVCVEVRSGDPSTQSAEKFFHLHFSVVWIGSRSVFVLCTALLTAEYAEGDRAQLEGQQLGGVECVRLLLNHELHVVSSVV